MSKTITIKLTKAGFKTGPFTIQDQFGNIIASDVARNTLAMGISYIVDDNVEMVTLISTGKYTVTKTVNVSSITVSELVNTVIVPSYSSCLWKHLVFNTFNSYYGVVEPYVLEYPLSWSFNDQLLQNIVDYTKSFRYYFGEEFDSTNKVEVDDSYFNHAIIYNGQQSSGILTLVPKPKNNLKNYMLYPIYRSGDKVITYTKSDNFYNINTFHDIVKDKTVPLFIKSCESLSTDKEVNQVNMDYGQRAFNKSPLRAKDVKIRYILNDRSDVHLVSQFVVTSSQISYK